jgi:hypothetical protein
MKMAWYVNDCLVIGMHERLQAARQYHREAASSRRSAQALKAAMRARSDANHAAAEVSDLQVLPKALQPYFSACGVCTAQSAAQCSI